MAIPVRRGAGDDDALRIDHLAHHTARAVRRRHEHGADAGLFGGDFLQAAEEDVARCVAAGQRDAQPAEQRAKERIERTGLGQREAQRGVGAGVFRDVSEPEHRGDGDEGVTEAVDGLSVDSDELTRRKTHDEASEHGGGENPGAGGGKPVESEHRFLGLGWFFERGLWHHGIIAHDDVVQPGDVKRRSREFIDGLLESGNAPEEDEEAEKNPRHPRAAEELGGGRSCRRDAVSPLGLRSIHVGWLPPILRFPELQQHHHGSDRSEGGDDVHEPRPVIIGHEELRNGERDASGQRGGPDAEHSPEASLRPHHPERDDEREERELASDHLREGELIDAGDFAERDDRRAQRTEGDGRGVRDERKARGGERFEAELDQDRRRDGDRRAEAGAAFEERSEGKRDEDDLHARIRRNAGEAAAQHGEETFLDRELVEEDQVQDDPSDGKQSVACAEEGGRRRRFHRHVIHHDGDSERECEPEQRREVNADVQPGDGSQQHDDGDCGDEGGEQGVAERVVVLRPGHDGCGEENGNRAGMSRKCWGRERKT